MNCFDSLKEYNEFYKSKGFDLNVHFTLEVISNYYEYDSFYQYYNSMNKIDQSVMDEALLSYYTYGIYHQVDSIKSSMNSEEFDKVLNNSKVQKIVGTKYIAYLNSISYETLFKLLKENKYRVSGNMNHFTAYDKAGNKYEFSKDFYDMENNGSVEYKAYYYIENNKHVRCTPNISTETVYKLFSLSITLENNK
jgi:hypothetical protein